MHFLKKLKFPQLSKINFLHISQFFFGSAVFLLPLRIRSLLYFGDSYSFDFFNEYLAFFVHASEILLLLAFFFLGIALLFKFVTVDEFTFPPSKILIPFFILLAVSAIAVPFARDPLLALLHFWRLLEFALAAFFIASRIFDRNAILRIFVAALFFQTALATAQFFAHGELGFHFFGESFFTAETFNVAKTVLPTGEVLVRGMGTLAHANILGGLAAIALLLLAMYPRKSAPVYFVSAVIFAGMFFSFSRAAYLAFFVGIFVLLVFQFRRRIISSLAAFSIFGILLFVFGSPFFVRLQSDSGIPSRLDQISHTFEISKKNPFSVGRGAYTLSLAENFPHLENWQLQPVHNFFALKFAEESALTAFAWLAVFASLAWQTFRRKKFTALALLVATFILANFDHYFSTNFSAEAVLWIVLGFVVAEIADKKMTFRNTALRNLGIEKLK
ncbi:O-antigen ligase family protein [Candidatus Gracilibacteria bacterium]|nr:O-antigen ligase family protein [Candidatus Gracilibacteria bacterium]